MAVSGIGTRTIDISGLANGVYAVRVVMVDGAHHRSALIVE
jgi:hypothetical protein